MSLDHEKFKNICSGLQSLVLTLAIVVGGLWSAYTFRVLGQVDRARLELYQIEERIKGVPSLDLSVATTQVNIQDMALKGLIVEVLVRNTGTKAVNLDLSQKPLRVSKVIVAPDGQLRGSETVQALSYFRLDEANPDFQIAQSVQPNSLRTIPFYVQLRSPGVYMASFTAPIDRAFQEELERGEIGADSERLAGIARKKGMRTIPPAYWVAHKFVYVR